MVWWCQRYKHVKFCPVVTKYLALLTEGSPPEKPPTLLFKNPFVSSYSSAIFYIAALNSLIIFVYFSEEFTKGTTVVSILISVYSLE